MKITKVLFWGGLILDALSLLQRIWEGIKMIDMRIVLEFGILIMVVICAFILVYNKYRQYEDLRRWINFPTDPTLKYNNLADMIISEINLKIKP